MNCPKCNEKIPEQNVYSEGLQMLMHKMLIARGAGISIKEFFDTTFHDYGIMFYGSDKQFREFVKKMAEKTAD